MTDLFAEAAELQKILEGQGWQYFFVGGIALQIWGQPRLTTDLDLTIFTGLIHESEQVDRLLDLFGSRFPTRKEATEFSRFSRILLLKSKTGIEIDMMLGGLADIGSELERSSVQQFTPEISLRVCSAETLVAQKTVAGRSQDFVDVESVLIKQTDLEWDYIDEYLMQVTEYEDITENLTKLKKLKAEFYRR